MQGCCLGQARLPGFTGKGCGPAINTCTGRGRNGVHVVGGLVVHNTLMHSTSMLVMGNGGQQPCCWGNAGVLRQGLEVKCGCSRASTANVIP